MHSIPPGLEGAAELLSDDQRTRINRQLETMYGVTGDEHDALAEAKASGMREVLYRDLPIFRLAELPLHTMYVRLYDGHGNITACSANKVEKYVHTGYTPVETLEVWEAQ